MYVAILDIPLCDTLGFKSLFAILKVHLHCSSRDLGQIVNKVLLKSAFVLLYVVQ